MVWELNAAATFFHAEMSTKGQIRNLAHRAVAPSESIGAATHPSVDHGPGIVFSLEPRAVSSLPPSSLSTELAAAGDRQELPPRSHTYKTRMIGALTPRQQLGNAPVHRLSSWFLMSASTFSSESNRQRYCTIYSRNCNQWKR